MEHFEKVGNKDCSETQIINTTAWGPEACAMMCRKYLHCYGIKWDRAAVDIPGAPNCILFKECDSWEESESIDIYVKGGHILTKSGSSFSFMMHKISLK